LLTDVSRLRPHLCTIIPATIAEADPRRENNRASLLDWGHKSNLSRNFMRK
jgi:hypothetical protein